MARMRKATYAELVMLRADRLWQVLRDFVEMRPYLTVAPEAYEEDGEVHVLRASLHQVERADGGYVMVTKENRGKAELLQVAHLEDWEGDVRRDVNSGSGEEREAWARLLYGVIREKAAYWERKKERGIL